MPRGDRLGARAADGVERARDHERRGGDGGEAVVQRLHRALAGAPEAGARGRAGRCAGGSPAGARRARGQRARGWRRPGCAPTRSRRPRCPSRSMRSASARPRRGGPRAPPGPRCRRTGSRGPGARPRPGARRRAAARRGRRASSPATCAGAAPRRSGARRGRPRSRSTVARRGRPCACVRPWPGRSATMSRSCSRQRVDVLVPVGAAAGEPVEEQQRVARSASSDRPVDRRPTTIGSCRPRPAMARCDDGRDVAVQLEVAGAVGPQLQDPDARAGHASPGSPRPRSACRHDAVLAAQRRHDRRQRRCRAASRTAPRSAPAGRTRARRPPAGPGAGTRRCRRRRC